MPAPCGDVTLLLNELRQGNQEAAKRLIPLIYSELRRMAGSYMQIQNVTAGYHSSDNKS